MERTFVFPETKKNFKGWEQLGKTTIAIQIEKLLF